MGNLSFYAEKQILVNLHLVGINISQVVQKLTEEDCIMRWDRPGLNEREVFMAAKI